MPYSVSKPVPPVSVASSLNVGTARLIAGKCWNLQAVVAAIKRGALTVVLTTKAQSEALVELGFIQPDVVSFMKNLEPHHYVNSQWCLPPAGGNKHAPYPADSYEMGYDRFKNQESAGRKPYFYIKFAVNATNKVVLVFSMHASRKI